MNKFVGLSGPHDTIAKDFVLKKLDSYGFTTAIWQGHEGDFVFGEAHPRTDLGLKVRFKPDIAVVEGGEFYLEIKTRLKKYINWSVQIESFWACKQEKECYYAFVECINGKIGKKTQCCKVLDLEPYVGKIWEIQVPPRFQTKKYFEWLEEHFPNSKIEKQPGTQGGSDTAYFLIPERHRTLTDMDIFFKNGAKKGLII